MVATDRLDHFPPALPGAACRRPGVDPEWFFPHRGQQTKRAKAVCSDCPERAACLAWALGDHRTRVVGIWGGTTELDRRKLRGRNGSAVVAALDDVAEPGAAALAAVEAEAIETGTGGPERAPNGSGVLPVEVHRCGHCGTRLVAHQAKWCSESCRRKAAYRRRGRKPRAVAAVATRAAVNGHAVLPPGPFDQLAAVASVLPAGWRMEATASTVTVTWSVYNPGVAP
jgi:WhiB family redox-sensing transcriptional regulator